MSIFWDQSQLMSIAQAYNAWSDSYDTNENKTRDLDQQVTRKILERYDFQKVLELGCGTGKNTVCLLEKASQVTAVDFSEGMLVKAKAKMKTPKVSFLQADITRPWPSTIPTVDLITCNLTLEHISDLGFIFQQAGKKLIDKGLFFICELHPFKQYLGSKARFDTENGVQELKVYQHHISEYLQKATANGFELIELKEWFDEGGTSEIPRLLSLVFRKSSLNKRS